MATGALLLQYQSCRCTCVLYKGCVYCLKHYKLILRIKINKANTLFYDPQGLLGTFTHLVTSKDQITYCGSVINVSPSVYRL